MGKILVTGSNGFVGNHLLKILSKTTHVIAFDNGGNLSNLNKNIDFIHGDLTKKNDFSLIDSEIEGIVHLGAVSRLKDGIENPLKCMNVNVMGTLNLLDFAKSKKVPPWIILGGTNENNNNNIYGISKHTAETCAEQFSNDYNLKIVVLKFTNIYGSSNDNPDKLIPKLVSRALNNQDITIDDPNKHLDFIFIDDLIKGILAGIKFISKKNHPFFEKIPLCTGTTSELGNITKIIIKEAGSKSKILEKLPKISEKIFNPDPKKALKLLKFKSNVMIEDGIRETVKDFEKNIN